MMIIPELHVVVIQPPRTGTTAFRDAILGKYPRAISLYRHMEHPGIPTQFSHYRVACTIRHPLDRLWSLHKFMKWFPRTPTTPEDWLYIEGLKADADRPFDDWLVNSMHSFHGNSDYHSVLNYKPITQKSQWHYARPDYGPIDLFKIEEREELEEHFDITLLKTNQSEPLGRPPMSPEIWGHIYRYHEWDMEQYDHAAFPSNVHEQGRALC